MFKELQAARRRCQQVRACLLSVVVVLAFLAAAGSVHAAGAGGPPQFLIKSYGGKCLDYGPRWASDSVRSASRKSTSTTTWS
jgi:hypothetical protein